MEEIEQVNSKNFCYKNKLPKKMQSKNFSAPPIDHYNFYRRQDNNREEDEEEDEVEQQNQEIDLEPYREQIARFEQTLTTGTSAGMIWNNNIEETTKSNDFEENSQIFPASSCFDTSDKHKTNTTTSIFSMDREHLEVIRLELANNNNSQDIEDCDESSQEGNNDEK